MIERIVSIMACLLPSRFKLSSLLPRSDRFYSRGIISLNEAYARSVVRGE